MIETDKETTKIYKICFNETYSIAFIAFAVLEEMLVQMYNWSLCIQHMIKCTFVFKGNLCTLIKVTQFRIQLTVCECCLLVETCIFMYLVYTEYIDHPLRIYLFFISFLRFGLPSFHTLESGINVRPDKNCQK